MTGRNTSAASIRGALPRHKQLRALRVQDPTIIKYHSAVSTFREFAVKQRWVLKKHDIVDTRLAEYFADLLEQGHLYNDASYTLFGWILLVSDESIPERNLFPRARQALKGWATRHPQCSRTGADPQLWYLLASHVADVSPPMAAAMLLQLDTYTRPSEILKVRKRDVVSPVSKTCSFWGIIIGNSEFKERTKTNTQDDTTLLDSTDRPFAAKILKLASQHTTHADDFIFGEITLAQYEDAFRQARQSTNLAKFELVPHAMRHTGPSVDFLHKSRSAASIMSGGRWKSLKSIQRYMKPGQMLARMKKVPEATWVQAADALQVVMRKLLKFYGG